MSYILNSLMIVMVLLVTQVGVAKEQVDYSAFKEFAPFVKTFDETARSRGYLLDFSRIKIRYTSIGDGNSLGVCWPDTEGATIIINRDTFEPKWWPEKEQIIWHELGHCMLGKPHDDRLQPNGMPVSIMYPAQQPFHDHLVWYLAHKDEYIRQFFPSIVDLFFKIK